MNITHKSFGGVKIFLKNKYKSLREHARHAQFSACIGSGT